MSFTSIKGVIASAIIGLIISPLNAVEPAFHFDTLLSRPIEKHQQFLETITYRAETNGQFAYEIEYTVSKLPLSDIDHFRIDTQIIGPKIVEKNLIYMNIGGEVQFVYQESSNKADNVFFKWEVDNRTHPASATQYYTRSKRVERTTVDFPENGYPIQALLFLLNSLNEISDFSQLDFKLLIPPAQFFPLAIRWVGDGTINLLDRSYPVQIVEIGLPGLMSFLLPKYRFWISKETPNIILKYQFSDTVVNLVSYEQMMPLPVVKRTK